MRHRHVTQSTGATEPLFRAPSTVPTAIACGCVILNRTRFRPSTFGSLGFEAFLFTVQNLVPRKKGGIYMFEDRF